MMNGDDVETVSGNNHRINRVPESVLVVCAGSWEEAGTEMEGIRVLKSIIRQVRVCF